METKYNAYRVYSTGRRVKRPTIVFDLKEYEFFDDLDVNSEDFDAEKIFLDKTRDAGIANNPIDPIINLPKGPMCFVVVFEGFVSMFTCKFKPKRRPSIDQATSNAHGDRPGNSKKDSIRKVAKPAMRPSLSQDKRLFSSFSFPLNLFRE